jgi:hypothetical protein
MFQFRTNLEFQTWDCWKTSRNVYVIRKWRDPSKANKRGDWGIVEKKAEIIRRPYSQGASMVLCAPFLAVSTVNSVHVWIEISRCRNNTYAKLRNISFCWQMLQLLQLQFGQLCISSDLPFHLTSHQLYRVMGNTYGTSVPEICSTHSSSTTTKLGCFLSAIMRNIIRGLFKNHRRQYENLQLC